VSHFGGCSNRDCICWEPRGICPEFMESDFEVPRDPGCARCGWEAEDHSTRRQSL